MRHFFPDLDLWLHELPDPRKPRLTVYHKRFLFWWGLLLFVFKQRSRRQLDFNLRDLCTHVLANLNRLARTSQDSLPVSGTLDYFVGRSKPAAFLAGLRASMIQRLIRMKALDDARLLGHFPVAVDGSGWLSFRHEHCKQCLRQENNGSFLYQHQALEAKLLGPAGTAFSIETEFIENDGSIAPELRGEKFKQDCELKAFHRLIPRLKRTFPQLKLCITADALDACAPAIKTVEEAGWKYVFTFKEGRLPACWKEFESLAAANPSDTLTVKLPGEVTQVYRWVNGVTFNDDKGKEHSVNALECVETARGKSTRFAWITNFLLSGDNVAVIAEKGGRARWKIENQGFNIQKNSDLDLEHPYSTNPRKIKVYYYLLQIAHILLQLVEKGSLLRNLAEKAGKTPLRFFGSLRNMAVRLLEAWRSRAIPEDAFDLVVAGSLQIRFSDS